MQPETVLAPGLLLAAPALGDPHFERTVVLLGHHDGRGAMGWIINGAAVAPVKDLLLSSGLIPEDTKLPTRKAFQRTARVGGPVDAATGWLIYKRDDAPLAGELALGSDLAVSGDADALAAVIRGEGPRDFRMVIGYAGWSSGQLEREIRFGSWLPAPVDASLLFGAGDEGIWEAAYQHAVGATPAAFTNRRGQA